MDTKLRSTSRRSRHLGARLSLVVALVAACLAAPANAAAVSPDTSGKCAALAEKPAPEVVSISAKLVTGGGAAGQTGLPEFCLVQLTVDPQINIELWLPTTTYNGRFQAVGGGGYAGAISYAAMAGALRTGYATASTDTGHRGADGSFALDENGQLNWGLIKDFASRSLIELTKSAKTMVKGFYGRPAEYSYWNGCSTGGRQGLMLAQRLPDAYDGILAGAPAINWDRFIAAEMWPQVVMQEELGGAIAPCKLSLATEAAKDHCDRLDGVRDRVLGDPRMCRFDARKLVGQDTVCGEFTAADARVVNAIWAGPETEDGAALWYGLTRGTQLGGLAGPQPFPIAEAHQRFWIEQNPLWDWRTLDRAGFEENFSESQQKFNAVIGTDDPDLSPFRAAGGKVLMWHGWEDQLIFPAGTIDYYENVLDALGNKKAVAEFARLFMAPGVGHCRGGSGASTFDMFSALVKWVERDAAPERIVASKVSNGVVDYTRPLCLYPTVARYDGRGDSNRASSFNCRPNYGRPASTPTL